MSIHKPSQETYDYISQWIDADFFFSIKDLWDRMGLLGVFGDYILSCTKGDILEIGTGESSIYLSALTRKFNRHIYYCDASASKIDNPLTIEGYLAPERGTFFRCDSDRMFEKPLSEIALGFIDGDHNYVQAKKDFDNLLKLVVDNGFIILHDTCPPSEEYIDENKCGDVYKLRKEIEANPELDCISLPRGCAMGVGFTICRKKPASRKYYE